MDGNEVQRGKQEGGVWEMRRRVQEVGWSERHERGVWPGWMKQDVQSDRGVAEVRIVVWVEQPRQLAQF